MRKRVLSIGLAIAVVTVGATYALATDLDSRLNARLQRLLAPETPKDPEIWPNDGARLAAPEVPIPAGFGPYRVFVDPGHGAKDNTGNLSCFCRDEQDFTLALSQELAAHLKRDGAFEVKLSRRGKTLVAYPDRVAEANAWDAHVYLSLHSDVRGRGEAWSPEPGKTCQRSEDAPGFTVLWSDEGEIADRRHRLARLTAAAMLETGFPAYDGTDYRDLYEGDPSAAGVFVDRHAPGKRIYVLRKPTMPSIIVETHNAWDPREAQRWEQKDTRNEFFATVRNALVRFFGARR